MAKPKPKLTEEQIKQVEEMAKVGLNLNQMSALLDISTSSFDRIIAQDAQVKGAIEKGRSKAIIEVGKSAYQQAVSGKVPAMTMFYLKCRAGWKETQAHEHSGPNGKPIETRDLSALSDEELKAKLAAYLGKNGKSDA